MAIVSFYEKPGCQGNARQKKLLAASGHELVVHDLLSEPWREDPLRLRSFFGDKPVTAWFNPNAPKIKQGLIKPELLSESEALDLMLIEPLLIRRPLLEAEGRRVSGFDQNEIHAWLGLDAAVAGQDLEACANHAKDCGA